MLFLTTFRRENALSLDFYILNVILPLDFYIRSVILQGYYSNCSIFYHIKDFKKILIGTFYEQVAVFLEK